MNPAWNTGRFGKSILIKEGSCSGKFISVGDMKGEAGKKRKRRAWINKNINKY